MGKPTVDTQVTERPEVQILDADGNDVTSILPRSLLDPTVSSRAKLKEEEKNMKLAGLLGGRDKTMMMGGSKMGGSTRGGGGGDGPSAMGDGITMPFSKVGASSRGSFDFSASASTADNASDANSIMSEDVYASVEPTIYSGLSDVQTMHKQFVHIPDDVPEEDLDKPVFFELSETETMWMFDLPSTCVPDDSEFHEEVKAENEKYSALLSDRTVSRDGLMERFSQTLHLPDKNKECQASAVSRVAAGCTATESNISDTYKALAAEESRLEEIKEGTVFLAEGEDEDAFNLAVFKSHPDHPEYDPDKKQTVVVPNIAEDQERQLGKLWSGSVKITDYPAATPAAPAITVEGVPPTPAKAAMDMAPLFAKVCASPNFGDSLRLTERLVVHAEVCDSQAEYRGVDKDEAEVEAAEPEPETVTLDVAPVEDAAKSKPSSAKSTKGATDDANPADAANAGDKAADAAEPAAPEPAAEPEKDVGEMGMAVKEGEVNEEDLPAIKTVWKYTCDATMGKSVTCMAWNKKNRDILGAGYGNFEFGATDEGLACCWSLKNTEFPERLYRLPCSVLSIDFAESRPSLMAVGLRSGATYVYDIANPSDEPVSTSDSLAVHWKHTQPAWVVRWAQLGETDTKDDSEEALVSASTDGRVLKGVMVNNKGVQMNDLMRIKRVTQKDAKSAQNAHGHAAFVALTGSCMSLDFSRKEPNIYLIGTEDGTVHKCSCSYNEQFVASYFGHSGPVYKLLYSPFVDELFLSCSADWSMRIWEDKRETAAKTLKYSSDPIHDCAWSPHCSTVLASVSSGGLAIWDLSVRELDPIVVLDKEELGRQLTTVTFAQNSQSVLYGDDNGEITVALLSNINNGSGDDEVERERLTSILARSEKTTKHNTSAEGDEAQSDEKAA